MCGIYGIARIKGSTFNPRALRLILKKLAVASKIRGRDATGFAFANDDSINIFKHNVHADVFCELDNYKQVIRENISSSGDYGAPYSIIGHTRQQTQGSHTNPDNNHPLRTGSIVGVHNGQIRNDDEVFKFLDDKTEGELKRIAQVDSEAIFALVDYYAKAFKWPNKYTSADLIGHFEDPTSRAIARAGSKLEGSYACALVDADQPSYLWIFKAFGQLAVHYYRKEKLLIFASVEHFIENAVELYNLSEPDSIVLPSDSGMCVDTDNGSYNIFSLEPSHAGAVWA